MFRLFTKSISRRLYVLLGLFALGMVGISVYQLGELRRNLDSFKRDEIRTMVEAGVDAAEMFQAKVDAGEMSLETAQALAMDTMRSMRYDGGDGYLFIDSFDYINLMHAKQPEKQGTNRRDVKDGNGKLYLQELIETAKTAGSTFVTYAWKDDDGAFFDKVTFSQAYAPWGWVISSGVLMTSVDSAFSAIALIVAIVCALVIGAMLVVGFFSARGISKPIGRLNANMGQLAKGDHHFEVAGTVRSDEIGDMARAVEVFRQASMRMSEMTEAEAARIISDEAERRRMMVELQSAFGTVVDAAIAGDFQGRVSAEFPDAELNGLARSVNTLIETVDVGLAETGTVLAALAQTDLTRRVEGTYHGAFDRLKTDTNAMADKLTDVVSQLRSTSRALKSATGEILAGANDLSERTTRQAATIEETSATMEQLAGTVTENAGKAEIASTKAQTASQAAEDGGNVMARATEAMGRIQTSSSKISNIIGMIDDIAFQTNLLALNASVEAARAGESGKGFAVVAIEVRRLAQSAAQASSEVKVLIEQSSLEVKGGSKLVDEASAKLASMLGLIRENTTLMHQIASASREQASSIGEINTAVRQMDEMTQHNAALVEETNAAIEQTEAQAVELDAIVDEFKLAPGASPAQPAARLPQATAKASPSRPKMANTAKRYAVSGNTALKSDDWSEF